MACGWSHTGFFFFLSLPSCSLPRVVLLLFSLAWAPEAGAQKSAGPTPPTPVGGLGVLCAPSLRTSEQLHQYYGMSLLSKTVLLDPYVSQIVDIFYELFTALD